MEKTYDFDNLVQTNRDVNFQWLRVVDYRANSHVVSFFKVLFYDTLSIKII